MLNGTIVAKERSNCDVRYEKRKKEGERERETDRTRIHLISLSKFNLPPYRYLYVTHAARALQSHDLSVEGIKLWIIHILFWPHKDMKGLPWWVISSMPGPPLRQHKHERRYTPGTHSFIPTRRIWNDDYGGQNGSKVSWHLSYRWGKTSPGNLSQLGIKPGTSAKQACMLLPVPQWWTKILIILRWK